MDNKKIVKVNLSVGWKFTLVDQRHIFILVSLLDLDRDAHNFRILGIVFRQTAATDWIPKSEPEVTTRPAIV